MRSVPGHFYRFPIPTDARHLCPMFGFACDLANVHLSPGLFRELCSLTQTYDRIIE